MTVTRQRDDRFNALLHLDVSHILERERGMGEGQEGEREIKKKECRKKGSKRKDEAMSVG